MAVKDYRNYTFSSGCVAGEDYKKFQATCKRELTKGCKSHGFNLHSFHPNHYEWSAVLERAGKFIYVSLGDVRMGSRYWYDHVLVRSMAHDKDWTGGHNNMTPWDEVMAKAEEIYKEMAVND